MPDYELRANLPPTFRRAQARMVHYDRINAARIILLTVLASLVPVSTVVGAVEFSCPPPATVSSQSTPSDEAVTGAAFPDEEIDLTIFAAASLTDAFDEIGDLIEGRYPNVSVTIDTAGSQTLVTVSYTHLTLPTILRVYI